MARKEGTLKLSSNIEPRAAAPLDARTVVPTLADLTASGAFPYPYVGMIVSVQSEGKAYMLKALDTTVSDNWQEVGSGSQTLAELDDVDINLIEWYTKEWTGLTSFSGDNIWSDGDNIYYSSGYNQYVLDKSTLTWSTKEWIGLTNFDGAYIWSDGENIYCSDWSNQYVLDKSTSTWTTKEWTGLTSINGENIWSDGENIYYSSNSNHYILDKSTSTWSTKEWIGLTNFNGSDIWTDGDNIYYSMGANQYVLDKSTSTWSTKTWSGLTNLSGDYIWTDGDNIYYSLSANQYVLDKSTSTWTTKKWTGVTSLLGTYIWTDGDNIYYSLFNTQCALKKHTEESLIYDWNNQKWVNKEIDIDIPKIFIGTTDEWEALPLADKKTYKEAHFTDDNDFIDIINNFGEFKTSAVLVSGTNAPENIAKSGIYKFPAHIHTSSVLYQAGFTDWVYILHQEYNGNGNYATQILTDMTGKMAIRGKYAGTWTDVKWISNTVSGQGTVDTSVSSNYTVEQQGYIKVGRVCTVKVNMTCVSPLNSDRMVISGLPAPAIGGANMNLHGVLYCWNATVDPLPFYIGDNGSFIVKGGQAGTGVYVGSITYVTAE